jgi:selenocysteine-specific elongation factor
LKQFTIGLSGHIDHGKTSIVKSLTGQNTDNLKDEIKRGLTIDIGFAHLDENISIIDVPGHEKFIKNMVSGVNAIDSAILVIAADDGIMPQTREHFDILKILSINSGVIVINKIDLVDSEWLDLVINEVKSFIKNSFLENAKIIKVSTLDNIGINRLKEEILNLSNNTKIKFDREVFRMFIDRVFIKKGFGTVVTGTVLSGVVDDNSKINLLPSNQLVTVRSMQSHNSKVSKVEIGSRTAINIQNIDKRKVFRGSHLGDTGYFHLVNNAIAKIEIVKDIKHNQRIRIHIGTQEVIARIFFADKKVNNVALLKFEKKIICSFSDRFIIRNFSPMTTIGGGKIFDINIDGKWTDKSDYIKNLLFKEKDYEIIREIINYRGKNIFDQETLSYHLGFSKDILKKNLSKLSDIHFYGNTKPWIITTSQLNNFNEKIIKTIDSFHRNNPYLNGIIFEQLNQTVLLPDIFLKKILNDLCNNGNLKFKDDLYSLHDFKIKLEKEDQLLKKKLFNIIDEEKFQTSDFSSLLVKLNISEEKLKNLLNIEKNNNNFLVINGSLFFSKKNYFNLLITIEKYFSLKKTMSVSDFKNLSNTSRKYAVPLLEYLDKEKITYRDGNERKYNKK